MRPTHTPDGAEIRTWHENEYTSRSPVRGRIGFPSIRITGYVKGPSTYRAVAYTSYSNTWEAVSGDGETWVWVSCS